MHEKNKLEFIWWKIFTSVDLLLAVSEGKAILSTISISTSLPAKGEDFSAILLISNVFEEKYIPILEPFGFEMETCFAFFSWAFLHRASFALFISSLQTLIQATLRSLLNSWTGFKKASSDDIKREVFSVYSLNPSGISIAASVLAILVFKINCDVTGQMWRENCVKKANARYGQDKSAIRESNISPKKSRGRCLFR